MNGGMKQNNLNLRWGSVMGIQKHQSLTQCAEGRSCQALAESEVGRSELGTAFQDCGALNLGEGGIN